MQYRVAVDIGGTFTDVVVIDQNEGTITTGKSLSTPPEYKKGVIDALKVGAAGIGNTLEGLLKQTGLFCLGTTIATNAIMTRMGVKTGLITTRGFEDIIHMARGTSKWAATCCSAPCWMPVFPKRTLSMWLPCISLNPLCPKS